MKTNKLPEGGRDEMMKTKNTNTISGRLRVADNYKSLASYLNNL